MFSFALVKHRYNKTNDKQKRKSKRKEMILQVRSIRRFKHSALRDFEGNRLASSRWWIHLWSTIGLHSNPSASWFSPPAWQENSRPSDSLHRVDHRWPKQKQTPPARQPSLHRYIQWRSVPFLWNPHYRSCRYLQKKITNFNPQRHDNGLTIHVKRHV